MIYQSRYDILLEVVRNGSFSGAARALGISGAAVSKQIVKLEGELKTTLFQRTTRKVTPTEAALRLADALERGAEGVEAVIEELAEERKAPAGRLRVNVPRSFGELFLRPAIADYAARYPEVVLEVDFDDRRVDLVAEGYDLALRIGTLEDSTMIARKLGECPLLLVASPALLEEHGTPAAPADLARLPAVIYSHFAYGANWHYRDADGKRGAVELNPRLSANTAAMMLDACARGVGIALLPVFSCFSEIASGELVRLMPGYTSIPEMGVYVIFPDRRHMPLKTRAFIDALDEYFRSSDAVWSVPG